MLHVHSLRTETFYPTKTEDWMLVPKEAVRLLGDDVELCNSIEHADWLSDPVIPFVCDQCWNRGCGAHGIAHLVRTTTDLLWMPPYASSRVGPPWDEGEEHPSICDAYLINAEEWERIRKDVAHLPAFDSFSTLTNHDLIHLWLQQRPPFGVPSQYETFRRHLRQRVIASHPLEIEAALQWITSFVDELASPPVTQHGCFTPISAASDEFNSLYFDGEGLQEWVAFAAAAPHRPVIAGQYVWMSE